MNGGAAERGDLRRRIAVASGKEPADLVIRNGRIADVFTLEIASGDIAVADGFIVGVGGRYEGKRVVDVEGRYVCPGLIDAHVHLESSMATPSEYAKVALAHGVTTVVCDPHEIANVCGADGVSYLMDSARDVPLRVLTMLPSCVPATPFEHAGAKLTAGDLAGLYSRPGALGLAEVMDYPSVASGEPEMLAKLAGARERGVPIDGHGAGLNAEAFNVYGAAGIRTDHECVSAEEARERLRRGLYVLMREGSAAKNLEALLPAVTAGNARRFAFCTDDKHLDELVAEGGIDHCIRLSVKRGMDPLQAIQIATLNAAECYGLNELGAVAPGRAADLLVLDDLSELRIRQVYRAGRLVAEDSECVAPDSQLVRGLPVPDALQSTVRLPELRPDDLRIQLGRSGRARVIEIVPNSIVTRQRVAEAGAAGGVFVASPERDLLKMAVVERHRRTGHIGLGIVSGFGFRSGAVASTVAHDSHNVVCVGASDEDMLCAIRALEDMDGGLVVVEGGSVLASLRLEIAGLITSRPYRDILRDMASLNGALARIGANPAFNTFLTLSFLCLPVIPELKLTDLGLFDTSALRHVAVSAE